MANFMQIFHLFPLIFFINFCFAQRPIFPNSIVIPVTKDLSTLQYVTKLYMGAQLAPTKLVFDLGGPFLWLDCADTSVSSSHQAIYCTSLQCSVAKANGCGGTTAVEDLDENKICKLETKNTISRMVKSGDLVENIVGLKFRDGSQTGSLVTVHNFLYSCVPRMLLEGLASGVKGMLGFGNTRISLPSHLSTRFGFQRKFAMCLSSSNGVILAGDGPYVSKSGMDDISRSLMYTPLVFNQLGTSEDYYINVKSIRINGIKVSVNSSLWSLDEKGNGGTKISTIVPYTTMQSRIYEAFVKDYVEAATTMNMVRVAHVAPFDVCFTARGITPIIDFVLQSEMVKWRVNGENSMVQVSDEVMCLGFLNGGLNQKASIIIGGHQLEENLLEFNLGTSMLGFSSLLTGQRSCSDLSLNPISVG